jgi:hypothetical protein
LFYWILIGTVSGAVLVLIIIAGLCGYKLNKKSSEAGAWMECDGVMDKCVYPGRCLSNSSF